jgi:hypothetical protein
MSEYALTPYLGLYQPTIDADDDLWGDHWNANAATLDAAAGSIANVLNHGADPTGVADSSPAFAAALALRRNGRPVDVYAPPGTYLLKSPITVGDAAYAQRLYGGGWSTILTVGPEFPPGALGVILIQPNAGDAGPGAQPSVCDLRIQFQQPPDFSTTLSGVTAIGSAVITVASAAGIQVGYYCRNITNSGSLPYQSTMPKVVSIAGNTITLDRTATIAMGVGNVMQFAANRSQAVPLSSAPTLNPGAPAIMYPWAIYAGTYPAQSVYFDHILVGGAWNGIYIRGSTFVLGQYFVGCLNVGLDIDQCYNFPRLEHFQLWGWGFGNSRAAMLGVYYDGQTVAMNIGRCDDFCADIIQSWCGIVNLTSTWSWGHIGQLKLDGSNANLNILGTGWVQIGLFYKTGGQDGVGVPVVQSGACKTNIDSAFFSVAQNNATIALSAGYLTIAAGYMWNGVVGVNPAINVTGGDLSIGQMRFDSSAARTVRYIEQSGGSVRVSNSAFIIAPGPGGVGFQLTDAARNSINNVDMNGWAITGAGPLGTYETHNSTTGTIYRTAGSHHFFAPDVSSQAQVNVRPTSVAAAEGKLRMFGAFPTGGDTGPRLAFSIRSGFSSTSWTGSYTGFYVANGTNDVSDDTNMTRVLRLTLNGMALGYDTGGALFTINGAGSGAVRRIMFQSASSNRFDIVLAGNETGSGNVGSDFRIGRYDDAGALLSNPILINRASGAITFDAANLAIGSSGPTIRSGTGAATGTQPKGSLWLRTDGAAGTTLYVSQGGGTWNPVAGV